jgi:hypothetical protein
MNLSPGFTRMKAGQFPSCVPHCLRVNQGTHKRAPSGVRDDRHLSLPEVNCFTHDCPPVGLVACERFGVLGRAQAFLACSRRRSSPGMESNRFGHPKGWTPSVLGPFDQAIFCGPKWPLNGVFRAIPALTGIKMKMKFSPPREMELETKKIPCVTSGGFHGKFSHLI